MTNDNQRLATQTGTDIAKAEPKPEVKLIDSLTNSSALEIAGTLPDPAFVQLLALQKSLNIDVAATSPTVVQVTAQLGEATVVKLVCAVLKLFNDGLNTSLQMTAKQLVEYAMIWCEEFRHDTLKDLILCLKRVKAGRYGPIFNRVDGTVVSDFFRKYLDEKGAWKEAQNAQHKSEIIQANEHLLAILPDEQKEQIGKLVKRPENRLPLNDPLIQSDETYRQWLKSNIETISDDVLQDVYKRAKRKDIQDIVQITKTEIERRDQIADLKRLKAKLTAEEFERIKDTVPRMVEGEAEDVTNQAD